MCDIKLRSLVVSAINILFTYHSKMQVFKLINNILSFTGTA